MAFSLTQTFLEFLKSNPEKKFTAKDIAEWIYQNYPDECSKKAEKSKNKNITGASNESEIKTAIINALVAEIGSQRPRIQKRYLGIKVTEERPRKYYYTTKTDLDEVSNAESDNIVDLGNDKTRGEIKEQEMYEKLAEFLESELNVYSKRIDEKRSSNNRGKDGNVWLHPDMVGVEDLTKNWHPDIKDCVTQYGDTKTRLWSFEVKTLINSHNVRKSFFQTVSNSSWANFGYLVALEINASVNEELRILSSLHGIGVIRLDFVNPSESEIIIPAREEFDIDWDTANRLAVENPDFRDYITHIRCFYETKGAVSLNLNKKLLNSSSK